LAAIDPGVALAAPLRLHTVEAEGVESREEPFLFAPMPRSILAVLMGYVDPSYRPIKVSEQN
jgi:hypothetical protein